MEAYFPLSLCRGLEKNIFSIATYVFIGFTAAVKRKEKAKGCFCTILFSVKFTNYRGAAYCCSEHFYCGKAFHDYRKLALKSNNAQYI